MAAGSPLLQMERVNKYFGDLHVLQDIDLEVDPGEVVVVVGPSGSGKSTLCRTINRLEPIDGGDIRLEGQPLPSEGRALARLRSDVGMVFQQFNLFAHRSVLDNVTLGPIKVRGQSQARRPRAGPGSCWPGSGSRTRPTSCPPSCRAASSSGWRSPAPWPWTPSCCCSTSRPRPWTRR